MTSAVSFEHPTNELKSTGKGKSLPTASSEVASRLLLLG